MSNQKSALSEQQPARANLIVSHGIGEDRPGIVTIPKLISH